MGIWWETGGVKIRTPLPDGSLGQGEDAEAELEVGVRSGHDVT